MRCPSCRAKISPDALSCPSCGRLLVAPGQVVEGTVVASSSTPIPIHDTETTTASVPVERPNRLARQRPRTTVIGSLARFVQDAWNEPVVRVAASAALIAIGERLADRLAGAERGQRRTSVREHAPSAPQYAPRATPQDTSGDRSLVPYTHPGELADRGYVGGVIETIIIIRRTLRRR